MLSKDVSGDSVHELRTRLKQQFSSREDAEEDALERCRAWVAYQREKLQGVRPDAKRQIPREEVEERMDELAQRYAETHDERVKAEIEALALRLDGISLQ
jgi:hypothetical protein